MNIISLLREKLRVLLGEEYNIGFVDVNNNLFRSDELSIKWLQHSYKKGWFADPFILRVENNFIEVLVEEFQYSEKKGCISKLVIEKDTWKLKEVKQILVLDTHLSFPAIFRYNKQIFIYPENCNSGKLILYKYDVDAEIVMPISAWCNLPLTDAIIFSYLDSPLILSTKQPNQNSNFLGVYEACGTNPKDWNFKYKYNISFENNIARNAGMPFYWNEKLIRPAQICDGGYGKGLSIQEFIFENGNISLKEIKRYYPSSKKWSDGLHTLNVYQNMAVVDGRRKKHPLLSHVYRRIHNWFVK